MGFLFRILTLSVVLLLFSCSNSNNSKGNQGIVFSIFPIYDIAKNISVGGIVVDYIVPAGANPHSYRPTPSKVQSLQRAKIFVGINREFDGWVEKFLNKDCKKIYLGGRSSHENPHIWLSLKNGAVLSKKIATVLIENDSKNRDLYQNNLKKYIGEIDKLNREIFNKFLKLKSKSFIQWHRSWDYMAKDYNLKIVATVQDGHGKKPSIQKYKSIVDLAKSKGVKVVVLSPRMKSGVLEPLLKAIGGDAVRLDGIGDPKDKNMDTYLKLIETNTNILQKTLGGK